jgi:hypothetical protein
VTVWTLAEVEAAIRASWSVETCDPVDVPDWSAANPARGQCGATCLVVHELLGGDMLTAAVLYPDGTQQGFHHWNRIDDVEVDLTAEQFGPDEVVQAPVVVGERPAVETLRAPAEYLLLRDRVLSALGIDPV